MNKKILLILALAAALTLGVVLAASAVGGAAFTTFNPSVDGKNLTVCKNSIINCNIYGAKEYVWLNGGPDANHLKPDGYYFFAVLEPGGQPNPNDQGGVADKNLSDDYDFYTNRTFRTEGGEVAEYTGTHWLDSNTEYPNGCPNGNKCGTPDGLPPYIRLFPYSDTTNPGGVYIMAICYLGADGTHYPVQPRDCKYDAFKVKKGQVTYDFMLDGYKIHDRDANGNLTDAVDVGLEGWKIYITGKGFLGEDINVTETTDANGYWKYQSQEYTFTGGAQPQTAHLKVCEEHPNGWVQSFPDPGDPNVDQDGCYVFDIDPQGVTYVSELNFGNYMPFDITVCKLTDDYNNATPLTPYEGWEVYLYKDGALYDTETTGVDGCYTWPDLEPGHDYAVEEENPIEWFPTGPTYVDFGTILSGDYPDGVSHTWINVPAQGCTPGFWQGGPSKPDAKAGGALLWDGFATVPPEGDPNYPNNPQSPPYVDPQWTASGGDTPPGNPYIHTTLFNDFFTPYAGLSGFDMFDLVGTGGGPNDYQKAARDLVAAYLNASWGMNYPYTTAQLSTMWANAVSSGDFMTLHLKLDAANNSFKVTDTDPDYCPISASGW